MSTRPREADRKSSPYAARARPFAGSSPREVEAPTEVHHRARQLGSRSFRVRNEQRLGVPEEQRQVAKDVLVADVRALRAGCIAMSSGADATDGRKRLD